MKKFFTWLWILVKRQFKNPFLIVMLVLIPVTAFIIKWGTDCVKQRITEPIPVASIRRKLYSVSILLYSFPKQIKNKRLKQ